jgi:hypothetical protein
MLCCCAQPAHAAPAQPAAADALVRRCCLSCMQRCRVFLSHIAANATFVTAAAFADDALGLSPS